MSSKENRHEGLWGLDPRLGVGESQSDSHTEVGA